jgi:hypothetical protein
VAHVLFCDVWRTLSDQINDALMGLKVLSPDRRTLRSGNNADSRKGEQRQKNLAGMVHQIRIAGEAAEFQMEVEVCVKHVVWTLVLEGLPHPVQRFLDRTDFASALRDQACSQTFKGGAQFKNLLHIFLAQVYNPRAPAGRFGDKSILGEQVDGLADGSLSDAELACPGAFHDAGTGTQTAARDLFAEKVGHCVLHERLWRIFAGSRKRHI